MKLEKPKVIFLLICAIFGIMISIQLKTVINIVGFNVFPNQRLQELLDEYDKVKAQKESTEFYLKELEEEIKDYEREEAKDNEVIQSLYEELGKYKTLMGYEDLRGPGVTIEIEDPDLRVEGGEDISFIVENYNFILQIITILNDNGAEAIAINNHRYTNFTELVPEGDTIKINDISVKPPIVISAIGNADEMERGLKIRGNIVWEMENILNYKIKIKKISNMEIKKYEKKERFDYAKPYDLD